MNGTYQKRLRPLVPTWSNLVILSFKRTWVIKGPIQSLFFFIEEKVFCYSICVIMKVHLAKNMPQIDREACLLDHPPNYIVQKQIL